MSELEETTLKEGLENLITNLVNLKDKNIPEMLNYLKGLNVTGIYMFTSPTNRKYVGQAKDLYKRLLKYNKLNCKKQQKVYYSLRKYSPAKHKVSILEICSKESLNEREIYWGNFYNTLSDYNLNLSLGKAGGVFCDKVKFSRRLKLQEKEINSKKVLQYDLYGNFIKEWSSLTKVSKSFGVSIATISSCCRGSSKTSVGYIWRYSADDKIGHLDSTNKHLSPVCQYDLEGKFIKEWPSIKSAKDSVKNARSIISVCRKQKGTSGGYIWRYKTEGFMNPLNVPDKPVKPSKIKPTLNYLRDKPVIQYTAEGVLIKVWDKLRDVKTDNLSSIVKCCKGKYTTAEGYAWRFKEGNTLDGFKGVPSKAKPVLQYTLDGVFIQEFRTVTEAIEKVPKAGNLLKVCKGSAKQAGGFIWTYKNLVV